MRVAAIYDVHGNLPALEAVLAEVCLAGVDRIVVGGDVLPGPMPRECLVCLLDLGPSVQFILGNGDREVLSQLMGKETEWYRAAAESWRAPVRWTAEQLGREHKQLLTAWVATYRLEIPGLGEVLFCHATPRNDTEIFTRLTPEDRLVAVFDQLDVPMVVCGHTHMQFDRTVGGVRVVNAGSVGMPFGEPGAYWLLLGPAIELRHTPYHLARAAERIRATSYPQAQAFADNSILRPPTEEAMLAAFARAELK
jgi:putative phosphoesterase